jgi:hypothetical protein
MSYTETYTATKVITSFKLTNGQPRILEYDYYISNTVDTVFNETKLGTVEDEKYMILRPHNFPNECHVFQILEYAPNRMILKHIISDKPLTFICD